MSGTFVGVTASSCPFSDTTAVEAVEGLDTGTACFSGMEGEGAGSSEWDDEEMQGTHARKKAAKGERVFFFFITAAAVKVGAERGVEVAGAALGGTVEEMGTELDSFEWSKMVAEGVGEGSSTPACLSSTTRAEGTGVASSDAGVAPPATVVARRSSPPASPSPVSFTSVPRASTSVPVGWIVELDETWDVMAAVT